MKRSLKPKPSPPYPNFWQRTEYALQWLISWLVIEIEGYPVLSGLATSLLLFGAMALIAVIFQILSGHWKW